MPDLNFTIPRLWRDVSQRTVLYYLFLLELDSSGTPEDELPSNRQRLQNLVSLQNDTFDSVISEYCNLGIILDEVTCRLAHEAIYPIEKVFDTTFGTHDPELLRYNGLVIAENTSESDRIKRWVEKATDEIEEIFGGVESMHFDSRRDLDARKSKKLVIQTTGNDTPFVIWLFTSNPRMTRTSEISDLIDKENDIIKTRNYRKKRGDEGYTDNGIDSIAFIAAPTYDESVAHDLREKHKRLIGPINFEGLFHYLDKRQLRTTGKNKKEAEEIRNKNKDIRKHQYYAIVDALREHGGVLVSGIVDCLDISEYLDIKLADLYATHEIDVN